MYELKHKFVLVITILAYIFLVAPLVIIMGSSVGENKFLQFPPQGFTLHWFENVFKVQDFVTTCVISLEVALISTAIALVIGVAAAYAITRYNFKCKSAIDLILQSPVLIPGIVLGFAVLRYIVNLLNTPVFISLVIGHTLLVIPYVIRNVSAALNNLDSSIEEAAASLGSSHANTMITVVLPNIKSGIISACVLSIINSFNNVPLSVFLTGPGVTTLPIKMLGYVEYNFDPTVAALSTMLMLVTIVIMFVVEKVVGLKAIA